MAQNKNVCFHSSKFILEPSLGKILSYTQLKYHFLLPHIGKLALLQLSALVIHQFLNIQHTLKFQQLLFHTISLERIRVNCISFLLQNLSQSNFLICQNSSVLHTDFRGQPYSTAYTKSLGSCSLTQYNSLHDIQCIIFHCPYVPRPNI